MIHWYWIFSNASFAQMSSIIFFLLWERESFTLHVLDDICDMINGSSPHGGYDTTWGKLHSRPYHSLLSTGWYHNYDLSKIDYITEDVHTGLYSDIKTTACRLISGIVINLPINNFMRRKLIAWMHGQKRAIKT